MKFWVNNMAKPKRYNHSQISFLTNKTVFFDTNIIIYIFWPTGSLRWEREYSSIFSKLLKQNNKIATDFIVVSEVINRAMRTEYEKYLQDNNFTKQYVPYKKFRDSQDGQNTLKDIYQIINAKILNNFHIIGKAFESHHIEQFLLVDLLDFSDKGIASLCRDNNCVLFTNDRDFMHTDIEILTSNPVLLR
jgi:predicted nucleic acid-binding protein